VGARIYPFVLGSGSMTKKMNGIEEMKEDTKEEHFVTQRNILLHKGTMGDGPLVPSSLLETMLSGETPGQCYCLRNSSRLVYLR
jgi:hypothetical protein